MRPYSIFPLDYDPTSGGQKVMWALYGYLLSRGVIVNVNAKYNNPDFVAIYPEIMKNNPAEANTVVRYILAPPGEMALYGTPGPSSFGENDRLYSFSKFIYKTDDEHTMFLPVIDTSLFNDQGKKRTKSCYFIGKGTYTAVEPKGCIEVNRKFAQDQQMLADFLNTCEVMYCYDFRTAMMEVARLCGCRVVLISDKYPKEEYKNYEPGLNGVSFGMDEAKLLDTVAFTASYKALRRTFEDKLDTFILSTQK